MKEMGRVYGEMLAGHRRRAALAILLVIVAGSLEGLALLALSPLLGSRAAASGASNVSGASGGRSLGTAFALFILLGVLAAFGKLLAESAVMRLRTRIDEEMRRKITDALFAMRWSDFLSLRLGDISKATLVESFNAGAGLMHFLYTFGYIGVAGVFAVIAFVLSPPMTLLTLVFGVVAFGGYRFISRRAYRDNCAISEMATTIGDQTADVFGNLKFFRSTGSVPGARARTFGVFHTFANLLFRSQFYNSLSRCFFETCGILFVGGFLAYTLLVAHQPPGAAIVFLAVFYRLTPRIQAIQDNQYQARQYLPWAIDWQKRFHLAQAHAEAAGGGGVPRFESALTVQNVVFTYPNTERRVLNGVSFDLRKGDCVALVGESGSGKSTLLDLVTGLLTPDGGAITLDGIALTDLEKDAWRARIGLVMQDSPVFHTSILENIAWGDPTPNRAEAERVARLAHAWEFITTQPDGIDTVVGEKGGRLSGGQRQRIALARALYRDPWLLILDEATSALDGESERRIQEALEGLKGRFAILLVAHRLKTVQMADEIVVLREGAIAERGTWRDLLARPNGEFARMAALQGLASNGQDDNEVSRLVAEPQGRADDMARYAPVLAGAGKAER